MRFNNKFRRYAFFISFFALLLSPRYFPSFRPLFFAPYLVISIYQFPLLSVLLRGIYCGTLFDLLSSHPYFGITGMVYSVALLILYTQKYHFFEDKLSTLPLMCGFFSISAALLEAGTFALFGGKVFITMRWIATDVFLMAFFDALYALLLFALPFYLSKAFGIKRAFPGE